MSLFIEKARQEGKNGGGLYLLGVLASFLGGQILGALPLLGLMISKGVFDPSVLTNPSLLGISNNLFLILALLPFIVSFLILWIFIRFVHKKRFIISFSAFEKMNWNKVFFAFFLWMGFLGLFDFIGYLLEPSNYSFQFSGSQFFLLLLISLTLLPIQTTCEELLFRSYLMQGIGMWKPYRIIPLVITSVGFGLLHIMNPEMGEYGNLVMVQYIGIGFLLGMLTILSDSIDFAIGLHAANNIYASVLVSFKASALTTDSLFYTKETHVNFWTTMVTVVLMALFYFIVHKKYNLLPIQSLWEKYK